MIQKILKLGLIQAISLTIIGAMVGALAGWLAVLLASDIEGIATFGANAFWALLIILPVILGLMNAAPQSQALQTAPAQTFSLLLIAAVAGAIGAYFAFQVGTSNISSIIGGKNVVDISEALRSRLGWGHFLGLSGILILTGLFLAFRSFQKPQSLP